METIHTSNHFVVCKAYNNDGRAVVLKIAGTNFLVNNPEAIEASFRAAELMRSITHKYNSRALVRVLDVVRTDKTFFIVMEYITGVSLAQTLPNMSLPRNQADLDEIEEQLNEIVHTIYDYGYTPATITASNVMVTPDDRIVLLNYINPYVTIDDETYPDVVDEFMENCYHNLSGEVDGINETSYPYNSPARDSYNLANESHDSARDSYNSPSDSYNTAERPGRNKVEVIALGFMAAFAVIIILLLLIVRSSTDDSDNTSAGTETTIIETPVHDALFPFQKGKLYGYKNELGKIVIPPKYDYAGEFEEGRAVVKRLDVRYGCGYIDQHGKEIIPLIYTDAKPFHDGTARVEKNYLNKGYIIDSEGTVIQEFTLGRYR
jgi:serine/threonine protein kinase